MAMPISIESVEALLRLKLKERVAPGSTLLNTGFRLFGRPENGITVDNFRKTLANLGIVLSLADATTIFRKYDRTNDGRVNFNEFLLDLFPRDFTGVSWNIRRDQEMWVEAKKKSAALLHLQQVGMGSKPTEYPASMRKSKMSLDELQRIIQQKIEQRAPRPQVQFMTAYKMFGSPKDGLTPDMFKTNLWRMGIPISEAEVQALFRRFDANNSGSMDFYEFIQGVMPTDYPVKSWTEQRDEQIWEDEAQAAKVFNPTVTEYPRSMKKKEHQYSTLEIETLLADKMMGAARSDVEKYRTAYYLFGRPKGGITLESFAEKVREEQLRELFSRYDTAKTGNVDFYALVRHILPKDYPTKTWTALRGEQMEAEEMRRLIAGKQNAVKAKYKPNMTLTRASASRGPTPRRSPTPRRLKKIQHTARSGSGTARSGGSGGGGSGSRGKMKSGSRPVSRALAARMNAVERVRLGTARRNSDALKE